MTARSFVGASVKRKEDARLVAGRGLYLDDLRLPDLLHLAIVRSPHAHARIKAIDAAAARKMPGVVGVFTSQDVQVGGLPCGWMLPDIKVPPRPALASGKARYVGEPVAIVVADTAYAAKDAAEAVRVDYEPLPAVANPKKAHDKAAPALFSARDSSAA